MCCLVIVFLVASVPCQIASACIQVYFFLISVVILPKLILKTLEFLSDYTSHMCPLFTPQVARLEAKVSGYERATFGASARLDVTGRVTPRATRTATHMRRVTSPRTVSKSSVSGMKKSSSDQNLHNLSNNSSLVTFSQLDARDMMESRAYPQMPAILVSQDHSLRGQKYSLPQDRSRTVQSSLETLEGLLKQANMEMARESVPLLLNTSTSQTGDVTLSAADLNSTQPSPPQKEERDRTAEIENGAIDEEEEQVSGLYENLHEQLEKKKSSLGMSRDRGNDGDSLDPERW